MLGLLNGFGTLGFYQTFGSSVMSVAADSPTLKLPQKTATTQSLSSALLSIPTGVNRVLHDRMAVRRSTQMREC